MSYWSWLNQGKPQVHLLPTSMDSPWGPFRIERCLGNSETGNSYLAYHEEWQRPLVLRVGRRAQKEQCFCPPLINTRLSHPGMTQFLFTGVHDGHPYAAREFVKGCSLHRLLSNHCLELPQRVDLAIQILEVLEVAHAHQLSHGHLVPGNVIVSGIGNGTVSLTDWRKTDSENGKSDHRDLQQLRRLLESLPNGSTKRASRSTAEIAFRRTIQLLTDAQTPLSITRHVGEQLKALLGALKTRPHVPLGMLMSDVHRLSAITPS